MTDPTVTDAMLEPCPFCASRKVRTVNVAFGDTDVSRATCLKCHADGPNANSTAEAIAAWNTRTATNRASEGDPWKALENIASHDAAANGLSGFAFELVEQLTGIARAALSAKPSPEPTRADLAEMLHRVSDRVRGGLTVDAGMVGAIDALLSREGGSDAA